MRWCTRRKCAYSVSEAVYLVYAWWLHGYSSSSHYRYLQLCEINRMAINEIIIMDTHDHDAPDKSTHPDIPITIAGEKAPSLMIHQF